MDGFGLFWEDLDCAGEEGAGAVGRGGGCREEEGCVGAPELGGDGAVFLEGDLVEGVGFL